VKTITLILADEYDGAVLLTTLGTRKSDGKLRIATATFSVRNGDVIHFPKGANENKEELQYEM
jgi:hypothetical protein